MAATKVAGGLASTSCATTEKNPGAACLPTNHKSTKPDNDNNKMFTNSCRLNLASFITPQDSYHVQVEKVVLGDREWFLRAERLYPCTNMEYLSLRISIQALPNRKPSAMCSPRLIDIDPPDDQKMIFSGRKSSVMSHLHCFNRAFGDVGRQLFFNAEDNRFTGYLSPSDLLYVQRLENNCMTKGIFITIDWD